ncbi:hypothetical protein [Aeromonas dhakensis]|uniref:hypothetical protein n=1 Tax=Aeromonas dhakensis TaxID=196024 RepID=UPI00227A675E|nr:hypothetical protein [Aeromonas dhakensis]WAF78924.1 hypothetical protein NRL00_10280 [Aeromonas dhakensis]
MKNNDIKNLKSLSMKLENLLWTLRELNPNVLKDALNVINNTIKYDSEHYYSIDNSNVANNEIISRKNPNKGVLIGVLPRLLQNKELFPQNEDIYDFARAALNLNISRYEKRSRYELIGMLICTINELDEEKLSYLVTALDKVIDDGEELNKIVIDKKNNSFSWNEAIQKWYKK